MKIYYVLLGLRFLHFMGLASLVGGLLTQMKSKVRTINPAIRHGAYTQLVTGIAMVALKEPFVNHAKVGIKFLILMVMVKTMKLIQLVTQLMLIFTLFLVIIRKNLSYQI